ncbi:MAG: hypothetical protein PHQ23_04690 [Candidatus Wallbacteria bacterium]|nr:hypothetical protein [Candidatus Wallbacteria bacterium]
MNKFFFFLILVTAFNCAAARLTVTVYDRHSRPLQDVEIRIAGLHGNSYVAARQTDRYGCAQLQDLPAGVYAVNAFKVDYARVSEPIRIHQDEAASHSITLPEIWTPSMEAEKSAQSFFQRSLRGRVFDGSTRKPLSGVRLKFDGRDAVTSSDGRYSFEDTFIDHGLLRAEVKGYQPAEQQLSLAGRRNYHDFYLQADKGTTRLSGCVRSSASGDPVRAKVVCSGIIAMSDSDGEFSLTIPLSGISAPVLAEADGFSVYSAEVALSGQETRLDILMSPEYEPSLIEGLVQDAENGEPVIGAKVIIGSGAGFTGIDGRYRIENLGFGRHEVLVFYRQACLFNETVNLNRKSFNYDILVSISALESPENP